MEKSIAGWRVETGERDQLLHQFAPHYERVVADHVTLKFGTDDSTPSPDPKQGEIVGEADDGEGVQALVVRIDGTTERGDGSHYHITWSLGPGREAKESNEVIRDHGWRAIDPAVPVSLRPERWQS